MKKTLVLIILVCVITGCKQSSSYLIQQKDAVECAQNWKAKGYNFDPNSMTCWEMSKRVQAISRAKYWAERGYNFDPNALTWIQMDQKIMDVNRARYWKKKGYIFDPNTMTRHEMDHEARELDEVAYWKKIGYCYDPNSKTVFFTEAKKIKLNSLANVYKSSSGYYGFSSSYRTSSLLNSYKYKNYSSYKYNLPSFAENGSYYGQISENTGRPKTVSVRGYYRKDGTYVRSHYRSPPRR